MTHLTIPEYTRYHVDNPELFSIDLDKKVIAITGKNNSGKTRLLRSILSQFLTHEALLIAGISYKLLRQISTCESISDKQLKRVLSASSILLGRQLGTVWPSGWSDSDAHLMHIASLITVFTTPSTADCNYACHVLIDDIELHLHPSVQLQILNRLTCAFPQCKFIITTCSPLVLSTVKTENVFIVEDHTVYGTCSCEGRDANSILLEMMDTPVRSMYVCDRLNLISNMIDDEKFEEAEKALDEFERAFPGMDRDPEVTRLRLFASFLSD